MQSGTNALSLERLESLRSTPDAAPPLSLAARYATFVMALRDDEHEYQLKITSGRVESIDVDAPHLAAPVDFTISAGSETWAAYLRSEPLPPYADLIEMCTERIADINGDTACFFQNIEYVTGLMRLLGHRRDPSTQPNPSPTHAPGEVETVVGRYVHVEVDGHVYRTFFEESGDGIPIVLLHAANSDARMWRHQLADVAFTESFRVIAFDMPWHGRSLPPEELLRSEYLLTSDFYRRFVNGFCDALALDSPVLVGCSMGGYLLFHVAYHDPDRYRALIAVAARDFEPRRWLLDPILRHPAVSFNRVIPSLSRGFMAPTDPPACADEVAWVYETGNPRTLRGDLHFAALDSDARPFMGAIDTDRTPFYLLGGAYDWSCTQEHTDAIKQRMPGIEIVRMDGIGHFPPDENPEVFNSYLRPVLDAALARADSQAHA